MIETTIDSMISPPIRQSRLEINAVENHPHELWQKQKFGVYHTSNGRRLPVHTAALILPRHEQDARAEAIGREDFRAGGHAFDPAHHVVEGARAYNRLVGLDDPHAEGYENVRQHAHILKDVGRAYEKMPNWDDKALPSFHHMRDEVGNQYDHLTKRMGVKVEPVDFDPYKNVHEMVHDLRNNKRIKVLKTEATGGHPFFTNDENDKFRAVHDAFGHAATGRGFDAHGEEAAFHAHSRMFSPHALPAMVSETRGQNAFLHLNGEFGDQKIGILPQHMHQLAYDLRRHAALPDINTYCPSPVRVAIRHGWAGPGTVRIARRISEDAPSIIRVAHDSGDAEVVFHCPFCGSGQVLARNDGTIECQFCQACFTVQVQPQYPAFPQTINGMPVQVPGMGPQWPGEENDDTNATSAPMDQPVPSDTDQDADGIPDDEEAPDEDEDEPEDDNAPPFAKKSLLYLTDNGDWLDEDQYMRHLALRYTNNRQAVLARIREENKVGGN